MDKVGERTYDEVNKQIDKASEIARTVGTRYASMSYEEGVRDALLWVLGDDEDPPIED
jgi:hypothetical protein